MNFFETNSFFIDEKVKFLKFENEYSVFNENAEQIGSIKQKLSGGDKVLRLLINKSMLPFRLEIKNMQDQIEATISRGFTLFMSKIVISDSNGMPIGKVEQKFTLLKPQFKIYDNNNNHIGGISGDWRAWNFVITDGSGQQIGTISKKWAGIAKEMFTTADKYNVNLTSLNLSKEHKTAILASAITIDMVLKENNK
ncbi:MAG TPA: phospholipid scramblase-related protein [Bacteroidales bacterium]|nr:phospholipid scramblase-related protein [Bacteroidales bacterium]